MEEKFTLGCNTLDDERFIPLLVQQANFLGLHSKKIEDFKIKAEFGIGLTVFFRTSDYIRIK